VSSRVFRLSFALAAGSGADTGSFVANVAGLDRRVDLFRRPREAILERRPTAGGLYLLAQGHHIGFTAMGLPTLSKATGLNNSSQRWRGGFANVTVPLFEGATASKLARPLPNRTFRPNTTQSNNDHEHKITQTQNFFECRSTLHPYCSDVTEYSHPTSQDTV
jgi:hypothetical protein